MGSRWSPHGAIPTRQTHAMTIKSVPPEDKERSLSEFRQRITTDVQDGIDGHERKMTRMGFLFLAIFVGVVGLMAVLP